MKVILGQKKGMTRVLQDGKSIAVTIVDVQGCVVSFKDNDLVEIGLEKKKGNKASLGKYKALGFVPRYTRSFRQEENSLKIGDKIESSIFASGDVVNIKAKSKGKGFAGAVKRYGFAGGPRTHGQSDRLRAPGSIGAGTTPGRVLKGKKMPGRMGSDNLMIKNKKIIDVIENYLLVSGPVPGNNGDPVLIYGEETDAKQDN
jgi:large subunit ribosomal protein L3